MMPSTGKCRIIYQDALDIIEVLADSGVDFDNIEGEYSAADKGQMLFWIASIIEVVSEFSAKRAKLMIEYGEKDLDGNLITSEADEEGYVSVVLPDKYFVEYENLRNPVCEFDILYPPHMMSGIVDINKFITKLLPF
jgi:hypothetical protein